MYRPGKYTVHGSYGISSLCIQFHPYSISFWNVPKSLKSHMDPKNRWYVKEFLFLMDAISRFNVQIYHVHVKHTQVPYSGPLICWAFLNSLFETLTVIQTNRVIFLLSPLSYGELPFSEGDLLSPQEPTRPQLAPVLCAAGSLGLKDILPGRGLSSDKRWAAGCCFPDNKINLTPHSRCINKHVNIYIYTYAKTSSKPLLQNVSGLVAAIHIHLWRKWIQDVYVNCYLLTYVYF